MSRRYGQFCVTWNNTPTGAGLEMSRARPVRHFRIGMRWRVELIYSIGAELKELLALARLKNFLFCMQIIYTVQRAAWPYKKVGGAQGGGATSWYSYGWYKLKDKIMPLESDCETPFHLHKVRYEYYKLALAFRSRLLWFIMSCRKRHLETPLALWLRMCS